MIVFLDTETTGLNPDQHEIWEIGAITRGEPGRADAEYAWQIRPSLHYAEPSGLRVGRYYERSVLTGQPIGTVQVMAHPEIDAAKWTAEELATELAHMLDGATIVGAIPWFDERFLIRWLRENGQAATHGYHLVDVETLAAGRLGLRPPFDFDKVLAQFALTYRPEDRHTALGDARMVRDLYDAVYRDADGAPDVKTPL